jgi:7,8-dihydropterin-6-yl-methyl-4-(beta-D-ribofuranosyl)aminobenzene 5'-phosphate synthase
MVSETDVLEIECWYRDYARSFSSADSSVEPALRLKEEHSIRVVHGMRKLAAALSLDSEEVRVAAIAGLLHDIGRFEPYAHHRTFVDAKSLSHGHYDHTGGLGAVLAETGPRSVFAHPSAFALKYSKKTGELRSIGVPTNRETLESAGMQLRICMAPMEVAPGVLATGPIPRVTEFEQVPAHFLTASAEKSDLVPDGLEDDQAMILGPRSAPVVVLGCAHSGIVNTLLYASELAGTKRFSLIVGGTHLIDADEVRVQKTMEALRQFEIMKIALCHCTGLRGQFALWEKFGASFQTNHTGDRIECSD